MLSFFVRLVLFAAILNLALSDTTKFVTCDLDLERDALLFLPDECQNLDEPTREALLKEADSFKRFNAKLMEYARSFNAEDFIYMEREIRDKLYGNAELHLCYNTTEILQDFLECMVEKREQMILEIDQEMTSMSDD